MADLTSAVAVAVDDKSTAPPIYLEQQFGSLCGQHCLNNLLQGPYFQAEDLAKIAQEFDEAERRLLCECDGTGQIEGGSSNVDDSGNFSIQVLSEAINRAENLQLVPDTKVLDEMLARLNCDGSTDAALREGDVAFVCNLQAHWFAIRSLRGAVWNLNSLKPAPEKISLFYLSAYLGQLREEGYSIFVVKGTLPTPMADINIGRREDWFVPGVDDVRRCSVPQSASVYTTNPYEEEQLQTALRESMRSNTNLSSTMDVGPILSEFDEADELQRALAASLAER